MPASGQTASVFLPPLCARHKTPASCGRHKAGIRARVRRPHPCRGAFDGNLQTRGEQGRRPLKEIGVHPRSNEFIRYYVDVTNKFVTTWVFSEDRNQSDDMRLVAARSPLVSSMR